MAHPGHGSKVCICGRVVSQCRCLDGAGIASEVITSCQHCDGKANRWLDGEDCEKWIMEAITGVRIAVLAGAVSPLIEVRMPPLGVPPRSVWLIDRAKELARGLHDYWGQPHSSTVNLDLMHEWASELLLVIDELRRRSR